MDMGVQNQAKGGAVQKEGKKRRSLDDYQLYIRDSDDEGMYSASREVSEEGGNNIEQYISFAGGQSIQQSLTDITNAGFR